MAALAKASLEANLATSKQGFSSQPEDLKATQVNSTKKMSNVHSSAIGGLKAAHGKKLISLKENMMPPCLGSSRLVIRAQSTHSKRSIGQRKGRTGTS
jgi:hypothetical protein